MPVAASQTPNRTPSHSRLATVPGVEIFATGEFNGERWTLADLAEICRNFSDLGPRHKNLLRSPVVLGHEETQEFLERTDLPAAGWPSRVWIKPYRDQRTGAMEGILKADFGEVPQQIAGLINSRAYRKVSAEIYDDFKDDFGRSHGKALRRISLLGGEIPKVKRLADIPLARFAESQLRHSAIRLVRSIKSPQRGTVFCFSEVTSWTVQQRLPRSKQPCRASTKRFSTA